MDAAVASSPGSEMPEYITRSEFDRALRFEEEIRRDVKANVDTVQKAVVDLGVSMQRGFDRLTETTEELRDLQRAQNSKVAAHSVVIEQMAQDIKAKANSAELQVVADVVAQKADQHDLDAVIRDGCSQRESHTIKAINEMTDGAIIVRPWKLKAKKAGIIGGLVSIGMALPKVWELVVQIVHMVEGR